MLYFSVAEKDKVIVRPNVSEDGPIRPKYVEKEKHVVYLYHELCRPGVGEPG
jgi:hypothetical protein